MPLLLAAGPDPEPARLDRGYARFLATTVPTARIDGVHLTDRPPHEEPHTTAGASGAQRPTRRRGSRRAHRGSKPVQSRSGRTGEQLTRPAHPPTEDTPPPEEAVAVPDLSLIHI
ncbi:hypothetical protein, partial [Streptomyces sp. gb14]|uniref:hypothetical protein n=1 Tax=Streptomyces sp. gb14 TaxID=1827753 RepID=UPI001C54D0BD